MSDKELIEYMNKIEPNFDSHLEKGTIEMSNEYYNLLEERMARIINKNQELKNELKEANDSITWWNNRFNAVTRDNKKLKDNWNKLKEYIKETKLKEFEKEYGKRYGKTFTQAELIVCNMILDKMQELQGSDKQ